MTFYAGLMSIVGRCEIVEDMEEKNRMAISIAENRVNIARHHRPLTVGRVSIAVVPIFSSEGTHRRLHILSERLFTRAADLNEPVSIYV